MQILLIDLSVFRLLLSRVCLKAQYCPLCFTRLCCCFGFHGSEASIVFERAMHIGQYWVFNISTCFVHRFTYSRDLHGSRIHNDTDNDIGIDI